MYAQPPPPYPQPVQTQPAAAPTAPSMTNNTTVVMQQPQPQQTVVYQPLPQQPTVQINQNMGKGDEKPEYLTERGWATGLLSCCSDCSTCCAVFWCLPCMRCHISKRMKESCWVPLVCPCGLAALRLKLRAEMGIKGSICNDYLTVAACEPCVVCQMEREKDLERKVTAVGHMAATVI